MLQDKMYNKIIYVIGSKSNLVRVCCCTNRYDLCKSQKE